MELHERVMRNLSEVINEMLNNGYTKNDITHYVNIILDRK